MTTPPTADEVSRHAMEMIDWSGWRRLWHWLLHYNCELCREMRSNPKYKHWKMPKA